MIPYKTFNRFIITRSVLVLVKCHYEENFLKKADEVISSTALVLPIKSLLLRYYIRHVLRGVSQETTAVTKNRESDFYNLLSTFFILFS